MSAASLIYFLEIHQVCWKEYSICPLSPEARLPLKQSSLIFKEESHWDIEKQTPVFTRTTALKEFSQCS